MNWNNRGDRIARMQERDQFNRFFMPLVYAVSGIGLLMLGLASLMRMEEGRWNREVLGVGKLLLGLPLPLWLFRFCRGHYSSKLKD